MIKNQETLQSLVAEAYGLSVQMMKTIEAQDGVYAVYTTEKQYALKKNPYPWPEFHFIAQALEHVCRRGYPWVNRVLPDQQGNLLIHWQGESYFLSPWLSGRLADFQNAADVCLIARELAKFHGATWGFSGKIYPGRNKWGKQLMIWRQKQEDIIGWQRKAANNPHPAYFDFFYQKYAEAFCQQIDLVLALLTEYYPEANEIAVKRGGFCHHDLAHHNILIDGKQVGFIDFDYCIADTYLHDLASFLLRVLKANHWRLEWMPEILAAYQQVLPLTEVERQTCLAFLEMPQEFWQVGLAYYEELPQIEDEIFRRSRKQRLEQRLLHFLDQWEERSWAVAQIGKMLAKGVKG